MFFFFAQVNLVRGLKTTFKTLKLPLLITQASVKLFSLVIKTLSKPLANTIKNQVSRLLAYTCFFMGSIKKYTSRTRFSFTDQIPFTSFDN